MYPRRAPSVTPLLRLLALALLVFGVMVAPVASALGDVHALAHGHAGAHGAEPHEAGGGADDDAGDLLHALMHSGHCHGHGGVLPMAAMAWVLPAPVQGVPPGRVAQLRSQPPENLLRPPIAA